MFGSHLVSKKYHLLATQTREKEHLSFSTHRRREGLGCLWAAWSSKQWLKCNPGSNRSPGSSALTRSSKWVPDYTWGRRDPFCMFLLAKLQDEEVEGHQARNSVECVT